MDSSGATCLVVGANGFIGSHLVDSLSQLPGIKVRALDRYSTGTEKFIKHSNVETLKGDIYDDIFLEKSFLGVDYLVHSFSGTTPSSSEDDPYSDLNKNVLTSIKMFELAVKNNIKKVVFISSGGAIYGTQSEDMIASEDDRPDPISPYGICKLTIEHYLGYYQRKYGLEHIIYRLTNPYGPRQLVKQNQGVIPAFIGHVIDDEPITILGDGSASRDFIFIDDAVKMITDTFYKQTKYDVYNIGSGIQSSLAEVVTILTEETGKSIDIMYKEAPKTFLKKTSVSIARFEDEFGKINRTSLKDGLYKTLESVER